MWPCSTMVCQSLIQIEHYLIWQVFRCLQSPSDLKTAGFKLEFFHPSEKHDALDKGSALYQTQCELSKLMWAGAVQIVRFRALSHMHYTSCPPFMFVGLLCSGQRQLDTLKQCELAWQTISYIEVQRHNYKELDKIWANMPFASWEIVREILTILSEFSYAWVPPHVTQLLESVFGGWGTSLVNELGFKVIRQRLKDSGNQRLHPTTTWMSLAKSDVMDTFGRRCICLLGVCCVLGCCWDASDLAMWCCLCCLCLNVFAQSLQPWTQP